jgi:hypothetical protein
MAVAVCVPQEREPCLILLDGKTEMVFASFRA